MTILTYSRCLLGLKPRPLPPQLVLLCLQARDLPLQHALRIAELADLGAVLGVQGTLLLLKGAVGALNLPCPRLQQASDAVQLCHAGGMRCRHRVTLPVCGSSCSGGGKRSRDGAVS